MRVKISVRAECRPEFDVFDERRAGGEREQLRQEVAERVVDRDRAVGAGDADMHVQAERVVAPDDVAQQLVVAAVVRRVDDALVLPAAPRMRAGSAEPDLQLARDECSCARRSAIAAAASAKFSQRPVRTSISEAISSPTMFGARSVSIAAA